jgi:hypothetical protein
MRLRPAKKPAARIILFFDVCARKRRFYARRAADRVSGIWFRLEIRLARRKNNRTDTQPTVGAHLAVFADFNSRL